MKIENYLVKGFPMEMHDCRALTPRRDVTVFGSTSTSVFVLVFDMDGHAYVGYYNYDRTAWYDGAPEFMLYDENFDLDRFIIANPYQWAYLPSVERVQVPEDESTAA